MFSEEIPIGHILTSEPDNRPRLTLREVKMFQVSQEELDLTRNSDNAPWYVPSLICSVLNDDTTSIHSLRNQELCSHFFERCGK